MDSRIGGSEAKLLYTDADYEVLRPGSYVICAVTGKHIPVDALRYWSVDHQEAYIDAEASLKRYQELAGQTK